MSLLYNWSGYSVSMDGHTSFLTTEWIRDVRPVFIEPGVVFREYLEWAPPLSYEELKLLFESLGSLERMTETLRVMHRNVVRMYRVGA